MFGLFKKPAPPPPVQAPEPTTQNYMPPQFVPHAFEAEPASRSFFEDQWRDYHAVHGEPSDPMRVFNLVSLVKDCNRLAAGDYLELGVHKGFTLRVIHRAMHPAMHLYGLDTFEGFDARDLGIEKKIYANDWTVGNFLPTSVEGVSALLGNPKNLTLIRGWFPDAFQGQEARPWRFVHIDFDLYQPIRSAMDMVWPHLVLGGVMVVHDYGCFGFPGARKAVDEFTQASGVYPVLVPDRWGSVVFRKPGPSAMATN